MTGRKQILVTSICDGISTPLKVKGFAVLDDNWVSAEDTLYDEHNNVVKIIDFEVLEINTLVNPKAMPYENGWAMRRFSAVKLDREVSKGDTFYLSI